MPIRDLKNPNRAAAYQVPSFSRGEGMPFMFKLPGVSMSIGMIIAIAAQAAGRIICGPRTSREPSITRVSRPSISDIIDGPMAPKRMAPLLTCAKPAKRSSRTARIPRGRGTSHIDLPAAGAFSCYALTRAPDDGGIRRRQDTDMNITRAIAVVACSLGLAACSWPPPQDESLLPWMPAPAAPGGSDSIVKVAVAGLDDNSSKLGIHDVAQDEQAASPRLQATTAIAGVMFISVFRSKPASRCGPPKGLS